MHTRRTTAIGAGVLMLAAMTILGYGLGLWPQARDAVPPELRAVLRPEPRPLTAFKLTDHDGRPLRLDRLAGQWTFVFFGYTSCPDICPTTLSTLAAVFKRLAALPGGARDAQVLFVSVDPQRDTRALLAPYVTYFNADFTGATGMETDIRKLAAQFGAGYTRETGRNPDAYLMSHTSSIFLVDPRERLVAAFSPPHDPGTIVELFERIKTL